MAEKKKYRHMLPSHKEYLDDLKEAGYTNMFGAIPWLMAEFRGSLTEAKATEVFVEWAETYGKEDEYEF